jgi:hypothetical protein
MPVALRGEYRLNSLHPPEVYLSPIDNRLHLKWAEHGIWRLDEEYIVRTANMNGDETIDVWSREFLPVSVDRDPRAAVSRSMDKEPRLSRVSHSVERGPIEALYALDNYLVHSGDDRVTLVSADYRPALFETLPPTDRDTWQIGRTQLAPYEAQRRDPTRLRAWLDPFPGPRSEIAGATVDNLRSTGDGFRFELALTSGYRIDGPDLLGIAGLAAGEYLVESRAGAFTVAPLVPAQLSVQISRPDATIPAQVAIANGGAADAPGLELVVEAEAGDEVVELLRQPVDILAGATTRTPVDVPSTMAGATLVARLQDSNGAILAASPALTLDGAAVDHGAIFSVARAPAMFPIMTLFAALLALATLLAAARRRGSTP